MSFPSLRFFVKGEFRRPEVMQADFLYLLDRLRERCGFPLVITSDGRTQADMNRIYGDDPQPDSPHLRGRAVDIKPRENTAHNRLKLLHEVTGMYLEGSWPRLGLEVATAHFHVDDDAVLRRPHLWVGVSR